jgi:hypothetical protein|tara:strand:+ start:941 stop:1180 length:240 start_codon:yes stop_codon:yes gene_type:complete
MIKFLLAWAQISLISFNTWQIANQKILGSIIVGFFISIIWSFNVQDISRSDLKDKIIYSIGATIGVATGIYGSKFVYTL